MCSGVRGEKEVAEKGEKRSLVLVVKGAGKGRGESQLVVDGVVMVVKGGVDSSEQTPIDCSMNGGSRVIIDVVARSAPDIGRWVGGVVPIGAKGWLPIRSGSTVPIF